MNQHYCTEIHIPFQHVDAAGVLFFSRLFEQTHDVYEGFMAAIGWPLPRVLKDGKLLLPIVHAEADYGRPMRYGDRFEARITVPRIGRGSWTSRCRFLDASGSVAGEVRVVHAVLGPQASPRPLPQALREALSPYVEGDASIRV